MLDNINIDLNEEQHARLQQFVALLLKWNKTYNLTAIKSSDDAMLLHIIDSLLVLPYINGKRLLDVGTGGGLPGIPLAIADPSLQITLIDCVQKKTRFLQQAKIELGLTNVEVVHARVESFQADEPFDIITSRAFASVTDFVTCSEHLLHESGSWFALKGKKPDAELGSLPSHIQLQAMHSLQLPGNIAERHLLILTLA